MQASSEHTSRSASENAWIVALDTGGTFTDIVARAPDGSMRRLKIPSDGSMLAEVRAVHGAALTIALASGLRLPDGLLVGWTLDAPTGPAVTAHETVGEATQVRIPLAVPPAAGTVVRFVQASRAIDAPRLGLHLVTGTPLDALLPPIEIRLSTTRGTNALLEGKGARVGVIVSDGLTGVVEIGDQTREDLFARVPRRTRRTAHATRAISERSLRDGTVELEADGVQVAITAADLVAADCDAIVVSLAHALANDREQSIAAELRARGYRAIAARDIAAHPRLLTRTETACVHATIAPILEDFVADATASSRGGRSFAFTSAAVLQRADRLLARDTLYSGPAGGARAACAVARRHGLARAIGFDMGGTSTDVSRVSDGEVALRSESRIERMTVATPSVAVDSVAAGGGSICRVNDGMVEVGPASAGSAPGPACFGRGGPLTITDINLLAGRMASDAGSLRLDRTAAERVWQEVAARDLGLFAEVDVFLDVANARMALAIESLCVRDGVDPRDHSLIAFGGAGGQHACAIADRLGATRVVFPRFAGLMCAQGVLAAEPARFATRTVLRVLDDCAHELDAERDEAIRQAAAELAADGFATPDATSTKAALRLVGQESTIEVPIGAAGEMRAAFVRRFREIFGYAPPARAIEVVSVEARVAAAATTLAPEPASRTAGATTHEIARILSEGAWTDARVVARAALVPGTTIEGPVLVTDMGETVVIDRSWRAQVAEGGDLVAERTAPSVPRTSHAEQELFAARLESIAVSMGNVLERTALSPNIRDRLDFSCAVLDATGTLIQNAPHLPVHLGALGVCTRAVMAELPLADGDIAVTNHPAFGGSHLPDVTTVAPVFVDGARVAFVAVRAHHAEIGGTRPGSFPPDAQSLAEEGVVLEPFLAARAGVFDANGCRARFAGGAYPSRNPDENLADLQAQIAATRYGVAKVAALAHELSGQFAARCEGELARADAAARRALAGSEGGFPSRVRLDDGSEITAEICAPGSPDGACEIRVASDVARHPRNFNAPFAVTRAAVLYALRLLINRPVPMNEGLLRSVDLVVPRCMLNPAFSRNAAECPPVVAGNVETSQSVVASLIANLRLSAESQSTMNNVLFGNDRFTIYETLGGGAGAGPEGSGASAVHVHMSNTRLTDIDVLERRAPVVIRRFEVRTGSGGHGFHRGGDGLVRAYEFREPVSLSFFGSRRAHPPAGAHGGGAGATGLQHAVIAGSHSIRTDSVLALELAAGDCFTVETPGGGGWWGR